MFERMLLYVVPGPEGSAAARWTLALARRLGARVFAVHSIEPSKVAAGPDREVRVEEMEEEAWRILYEVEDDAFELDVKLSLILEQGDPVERIIEIGTSYSGDLVVVPTSTQWPADLISRCPSPVVFVRSYKEE